MIQYSGGAMITVDIRDTIINGCQRTNEVETTFDRRDGCIKLSFFWLSGLH